MRSSMKKAIAAVLSFTLLFGCFGLVGFAAAGGAYPTVYVVGGRGPLYKTDGTQIAPVEAPEGYLGDAVTDCIGDLGKALLTGSEEDIAAYKEKLVSWVAPLYEDVIMDSNGETPEPIIVGYGKTGYFVIPDRVPNALSGGRYPVRAYDFYYDWRADPIQTAAQLSRYIDVVLASTGRDKVNLVGRCEGACPVLAYLAEYGHAKVNRIMFHNTASNGYLLPTQVFSGKAKFSAAEIKAWLDNNPHFSLESVDLSTELMDLLVGFLSMSAALPDLDLTGAALDAAYTRVLRGVIPDVLLSSYGTMPGVWAMVAADAFDDAVEYVFAGKEAQYAGLIEKIRYYHENVQLKSEELLRSCEDDGVDIGVMAKYGYPAIPLTEESKELSDGEALVKYLSFGATVATYKGTLSDRYIATREAEYVSPDKKVDASTCMFPETTWFFAAVDHQATPYEMDALTQVFFDSAEPMTVHSNPAYPRFMVYNAQTDRMEPLTEENASMSMVGADTEVKAVSSFDRFMSGILGLFLKLVLRVRAFIDGIRSHANGTAA